MEPNVTNPMSNMPKGSKNWAIGILVIIIIIGIWLIVSGGSKQVVAPTTPETQNPVTQTPPQTLVTPTTVTSTAKPKTTNTIPLTPTPPTPPQNVSPNGTVIPTPVPPGQTLVVIYTGGSFSPTPITIKKGYAIQFENTNQALMWVISNTLTGLNEGASVGNGGSYTFTFNTAGTWTYYNKNNPTQTGTIVVTP